MDDRMPMEEINLVDLYQEEIVIQYFKRRIDEELDIQGQFRAQLPKTLH